MKLKSKSNFALVSMISNGTVTVSLALRMSVKLAATIVASIFCRVFDWGI